MPQLLLLGHTRVTNDERYPRNQRRWSNLTRLAPYIIMALAFMVQIGTVWSFPDTESDCPDPRSKYLEPRSKNATRVLVFVHGDKSTPCDAWTNKDEAIYWPRLVDKDVYWPRLVKEDPKIGDIEVYVYHYPKKLTPAEITPEMLRQLQDDDVLEYEEIAFVAHSVGGNIVRRFIIDNYQLVDRVTFLVFLATPTLGIADDKVLTWFAKRFRDAALLVNGRSGRPLWYIVSAWQQKTSKFRQIPTYCAYEKDIYLEWYKIHIVKQESACHLCQRCVGIEGDHSEIAKPKSDDVYPHLLLREAIENN